MDQHLTNSFDVRYIKTCHQTCKQSPCTYVRILLSGICTAAATCSTDARVRNAGCLQSHTNLLWCIRYHHIRRRRRRANLISNNDKRCHSTSSLDTHTHTYACGTQREVLGLKANINWSPSSASGDFSKLVDDRRTSAEQTGACKNTSVLQAQTTL